MTLPCLRAALATRAHHVSPFLVLGDPDPSTSEALAVAAVHAGCTMLELGLPYDDPCADGPAIQRASARARRAGVSTSAALAILARVHARCPHVAKNLLVYGNLVHARGYARFAAEATAAGASSLLVPDIPLEETPPLRQACKAAGLGLVHLVAPLTPPERVRALDASATAFLYVVAHQGVTGSATTDAATLLQRIAPYACLPLCSGFGLSERAHLDAAFAAGAHIAVVGSHLARAIERGGGDPARTEQSFLAALSPLLAPQPGAATGEPPCS